MTTAVDLTDLDMWARGVPYREFARLRQEAPVAWCGEPPPNSGFWSVHCYSDIITASRDVATFSAGLLDSATEEILRWTCPTHFMRRTAATDTELGAALVPQRRPGHADEVAAVVAWLLSGEASYVNGAVIPVDGSAAAVDVGTMASDPRVSLRPEDRPR
jgi:Enoyl-(Acyl carrier protein) reductase